MSYIKFLLVMAIAIFSFSAVNAQTKKKPVKKPSATKTTSAKTATAAVKYQCPMKCEGDKTYAKEGKCPICTMNLAKVDTKKTTTGHGGHNNN